MRFKMMFVALTGLLFAGAAAAQDAPAAPAEPVEPPVKLVTPIPPALEQENVLNLDLSTGGRVSIQLRPDAAPQHVERIKTLARQGFYNGLVFHRVIEGFMAQTGDPTATGQGGSQLPDLEAEFNTLPHVRGVVSMARTNEPNSANSQFFIMLQPRLALLDTNYTAFGRVISGMNYVDAIAAGEPPANPSRILRASIGADNLPPMTPAEIAAANQAAEAARAAQAPQPTLTLPTGADTLQR
jgi:cyclophilin family peptidyl-prolyl cis-trans isomerase